jgi:hypothetical protein
VLLGLIAEDTASKSSGYLNSGLTVDAVREAIEAAQGRRKPNATSDNIPFSREVRKTFEAATNVSLFVVVVVRLCVVRARVFYAAWHADADDAE